MFGEFVLPLTYFVNKYIEFIEQSPSLQIAVAAHGSSLLVPVCLQTHLYRGK